MTLKEHFKQGYELFGPEAMQLFNRFVSGEIDWDTLMTHIEEPVINYRIQRLMWDEISKLKPKMIKITSQFAKYFYSESVKWDELYDELPEDATVGEFDSIPVEIDDTIENKFYELVY
jgi:hypothetical protein